MSDFVDTTGKTKEFMNIYTEPEYVYECELFGMNRLVFSIKTTKENTPNAFWRLMQYLIVGNKWTKIIKEEKK
jgi:hypothetical protein